MRLQLDQIEQTQREMSRHLQQLHVTRSQLQSVSGQVATEIKKRRNIEDRLRRVNQAIMQIEDDLWRVSDFIAKSVIRYQEMERLLASRAESTGNNIMQMSATEATAQVTRYASTKRGQTVNEIKNIREELLAQGAPQYIVDYYHPLPDNPQDQIVQLPVKNSSGEVLQHVNLYDGVARQVIGAYYQNEEEYFFLSQDGQVHKVDWDALIQWAWDYNEKHRPYSEVKVADLRLNGPEALPIFALELMHEEGYDVRTFQKNGDELINVSYIALKKAEKEANTRAIGDMLKDFGMGAAGLANFAVDLAPIIGNIKGVAEGIAGKDLLGNELTELERGLGILGGYGDAFKHGSRIVNRIINFVTNGVRVSDDARFILAVAHAGRYDDVLPPINRTDAPNAPRQSNSSIDQHSVNGDGNRSGGAVEGMGNAFSRSIKSTSEMDTSIFKNLKNEGVIDAGRSGSNRPLTSTPNSYYKTQNGIIIVYDNNGKLMYDISPERVKMFDINTNPHGKEFFNPRKLDGAVPDEILEMLK